MKSLIIASAFSALIFLNCDDKKDSTPRLTEPEPQTESLSGMIRKNTNLIKSITKDSSITNFEGLKENYIKFINKNDQPMSLYILQVDLNKPNLTIRVGTPNNANTANSTQRVSAMITARNTASSAEKVLAGVNGDYFNTANGTPLGPVHKNNIPIKTDMSSGYKFFGLLDNGNYMIGSNADYLTYQNRLHEVMGGRHLLLDNGSVVTQTDVSVNPRTTIGLIDFKTAIIMVVDGRQPNHSVGFTLTESAEVLKALGVKNAVNLDGGGSSVLITKDKNTDTYKIKNRFPDGAERAVANALFVVSQN